MLKCGADFLVLLEQHTVEGLSKCNNGFVSHLLCQLDANDVFGAGLLENSAYELRVASGYKDEIQLTLVLSDHFLKLCSTDKLTATFVVFQDQKVTLSSMSVVEFFSHLFIVEYTMSTKV